MALNSIVTFYCVMKIMAYLRVYENFGILG
jgi:hypothetical protein